MVKKLFITTITILFCHFTLLSQDKKTLKITDFDYWKSVSATGISDDGNFVSFEVNPQVGDGVLYLKNQKENTEHTFSRGSKAKISPSSNYFVFHIKQFADTIRNLKFAKTKEDKMPKDSLGIFVFGGNKLEKIARVKSFKLPKDAGNWLAYQLEKELPKADTTKTDKSKEEGETERKSEKKKKDGKEKIKDKKAPKPYRLVIYNPVSEKKYEFENITEYSISDNGEIISFVKLQNDTLTRSLIYLFDTKKETTDSLLWTTGIIKKLTADKNGKQFTYIHTADTATTKVYSLYYMKNKQATKLVDTLTTTIPENWTVSEHGNIHFSDDASKLYFGIALRPVAEPKDTLLDKEKVNIDIWNWKDPLLQPQQLLNLKREKNRSYLSVYHISNNKLVQIGNKSLKRIYTVLKGNGNVAIGFDTSPYENMMSWESPSYKDIYTIDLNTGAKTLIKKRIQSHINISSGGNYVIWYDNADSSWYAHSLKTNSIAQLTKNIPVGFFDDTHDYPNDPRQYGSAGWTNNDEYVLIYDKYDIWQIDPTGKKSPLNLTKEYGRKNKIKFRYVKLDDEQDFIPTKETLILSAFDTETKFAGHFSTKINSKSEPNKLIMSGNRYRRIQKAKKADKIIWQRENVAEYGNLHIGNMDFTNSLQLSDANPQQKQFNWMTAEAVKWITTDGTESNGLIYKPENFDPNKKYPMVVYFYRRHSDNLYRHYVPTPSRSIISPIFYANNGYIVFMPDVHYKTGYPGESSFNHVVSGTLHVVGMGFVDKNRIGIQGQSWGGYQVAYLITRTDLYAAASAGAPVTNMTSAYGGIRWGSGMSRMFQYEETQSRIGGTLWDKPLRYIENSPVFYADKVNTPLLMRHNDNDGAVPWYQGIEYFVALRRLNKPAWMLNYNKGPHNNTEKRSNQIDLSIRMKQFFDHYLKDAPAPVWMKYGVPAIKKGKTMGYEIAD